MVVYAQRRQRLYNRMYVQKKTVSGYINTLKTRQRLYRFKGGSGV